MSAQTTDKMVNRTTPKFFKDYPDSATLAQADIKDIENHIRTIGLYRTKAKHLKETAQIITEKFDGQIPKDKKILMTLPGVGEKTANVVLAEGFKVPAIAVDTHVERVSKRWGLVPKKADVLAVERKLTKLIPDEKLNKMHHQILLFGRYYCTARNPKCDTCKLQELCRYYKQEQKKKSPV